MSNVVSSDPSAFRRIRLKSLSLPFQEYPATRIRPSAWTVTLVPRSSKEMGTPRLPSVSNVVSSDPSAFKRIRLKSRLLPLWEYPATRIRPSGWTVTL